MPINGLKIRREGVRHPLYSASWIVHTKDVLAKECQVEVSSMQL